MFLLAEASALLQISVQPEQIPVKPGWPRWSSQNLLPRELESAGQQDAPSVLNFTTILIVLSCSAPHMLVDDKQLLVRELPVNR